MKKITGLIFMLLLAFCSCKKEAADYPVVQITSPYSMENFSVPGNINVQATVSDAQNLVSVNVYVATGANEPVLSNLQIPVTSNSMNVNCTYALNSIQLSSGEYYLVVSASNGTNTSEAFQQIYINGVPVKRTAIYAITRNSSGVSAWEIDSDFKVSLSYTVAGDFSSSDINSYYQQLYTAGLDSGSATAYSIPIPALGWSVTGTYSPAPYFTNVYSYGDAAFISYYSGYIKYYNHQGILQSTYHADTGYEPIKTFVWDGFLFVQEKAIAASQTQIATMYEPSGALYQKSFLPGPLVAMFGYDNAHIMVFGNSTSGSPYAQLYNFTAGAGTFYSPVNLPSAQLLSATQVNANTYIVSFNNGTIYQFTYNPGSISQYINGVTSSCLRYDSVDNELLASSGNKVLLYNYANAGLVNSAIIADSVRDVRILFNK